MARPLRLELEGAIYHLLARDNALQLLGRGATHSRINKADSAGLKGTRRELSNV
jgi:hypothetical protein